MRLCDCYNIPVVTLVNTAGQTTVDETNNAPSIAAAAELIYAYAEAVVPKVSVLCGQAVGAAYAAMGSKGNGANVVYAWPKAVVAPMNAEAAVRILKAQELKDGADIAKHIQDYEAECGAVATAVLNVPCRYIHSPSSVASLADVDAAYRLVNAFLASNADFQEG